LIDSQLNFSQEAKKCN